MSDVGTAKREGRIRGVAARGGQILAIEVKGFHDQGYANRAGLPGETCAAYDTATAKPA